MSDLTPEQTAYLDWADTDQFPPDAASADYKRNERLWDVIQSLCWWCGHQHGQHLGVPPHRCGQCDICSGFQDGCSR